MNKRQSALIGKGYFGSKLLKYIPELFNVIITADSKFDKKLIWNAKNITDVFIATPIETHYDICYEALMHGKNVFLEKPITTKTEDAEKLRDAAVNNKLKIFVDYTQAFSEAMPIIKQYMHQLGKIEYIEMESKTLGRFMDHDVYWLLGSHYIYILDYLIGVKDMRFHADTYMRYRGLATTGVINFSRNDLSGKILLSTNSPIKNVKIIIYCEDGSIAYTPYLNETLCVCRYTKRRAATGPEMTTELIRRRFDENNNIRHSIRRFYDIICNGEDTNIDAAIRVTQILEAIN